MNIWSIVGLGCTILGGAASIVGGIAGDKVQKIEIANQVKEAIENLAKNK